MFPEDVHGLQTEENVLQAEQNAHPPVPAAEAASAPANCQNLAERIQQEMGKAIVGQQEMIEFLTVALLAGGHVLLEGVPGTAKTLTVRALARLFDVPFSRIQFTPDLMPSDILGVNIYDPASGEFRVKKGPVFTALLLADEINRTPPKTQSALLEAMEEKRITIDGIGFALPDPFMVCATQNPVEYEGTYPLPEAQLDRFMMQLVVPYPTQQEEERIVANVQQGFRSQDLNTAGMQTVLNGGDMARYREEISLVRADEAVLRYLVQVVRATRENRHVALGASPRSAITLLNAARALAAMQGRDFVTPDDIKTLALPVLRHRLMVRPESELEGYTAQRILETTLLTIEVPR